MGEERAVRKGLISQIKQRGGPMRLPAKTYFNHGDRITIRETDDGLGVDNPTRRSIPIILFLLVWLAGWSVGEFFALSEIFNGSVGPEDLFLLVWVTAWTVGGVFAWSAVLWNLFGSERLFVTGGGLVREVGFWFFRPRRVYPLAQVSNLRRNEKSGDGGHSVFSKGRILFDAEGKTRSFGIGLDKDEADAVLVALKRHVPGGGAPVPEAASPEGG